MTDIWPTEIRLAADKKTLHVSFDNNETVSLPAERLRVESPSAEVQGHHPSEKKLITGKENVRIAAIDPVGNYAVRLGFDDGHNTGLYTWTYLYKLGRK